MQKFLLTWCIYGVPAVCQELSVVLGLKIIKVLFTLIGFFSTHPESISCTVMQMFSQHLIPPQRWMSPSISSCSKHLLSACCVPDLADSQWG